MRHLSKRLLTIHAGGGTINQEINRQIVSGTFPEGLAFPVRLLAQPFSEMEVAVILN